MQANPAAYSIDERDSDIVGLQKKNVIENLSPDAYQGEISVKEKIAKELAYVTEAMDLDANGVKHWGYRLKREYEKQEKIKKRMEQKKARKDYVKMMKKYNI